MKKLTCLSTLVFLLFSFSTIAQITVVDVINTADGLCNNDARFPHFDGNTLYMATDIGGLGISNDNGATWTCKTTADGMASNRPLGGAVTSNGKIFVGHGLGAGVSISDDGGNTWTTVNTGDGLGHGTVYRMSVVGNRVYASTFGGLSYTDDGGTTWNNITTANGFGANLTYCNVIDAGGTLYAGSAPSNGNPFGGLNYSTDGGTTWTNSDETDGLIHNFVLGVAENGGTVYVATVGGLGITTDNGATWTNKTTADGLGSNECRNVAIINGNIYVTTGGGISVSTDNGASFTNYNSSNGLPSNSTHGMAHHNGQLFVGSFGGVAVIEDDAISAAAVPTMGEWALIIFGLIIMSIGVVTVMRWQTEKQLETVK